MSEALRLAEWIESDMTCEGDAEIAAELRRLNKVEEAHNAWHEKTEWVQDTAQPRELGMHRADILRQRIDRLHAENEALKADAERYRWLRESGSIAANFNGLGVCLLLYTMNEWHRKELDAAIDAVRSKA